MKTITTIGVIIFIQFRTLNFLFKSEVEEKVMNIALAVILSIFMFFLTWEIPLSNYIIAAIIATIYGILLYYLYKSLRIKFKQIDCLFDKIYLLLILPVIPMVVIVMINHSTKYWHYSNYNQYNSKYIIDYDLELYLFGKCKMNYHYKDKNRNIYQNSDKCSWKKSNNKYQLTIVENNVQYLINCTQNNNILECPVSIEGEVYYIDLN